MFGTAAAGLALLPGTAFATLSTPRPLTLNNLHTGETLKTEFFNGKSYDQSELSRLNHFFRDFRSNKITEIDPQLFDHLYRLQTVLQTSKPVQLISGYRTVQTNNSLRAKSEGVAKHSYHTLGKAMDFHIEGTPLSMIRKRRLSCAWAAWDTIRAVISSISIPGRRAPGNAPQFLSTPAPFRRIIGCKRSDRIQYEISHHAGNGVQPELFFGLVRADR